MNKQGSFINGTDISLIEEIDFVLDKDKTELVLKIDLEKPSKIFQIRIPRGNNNVHCSLPKIENPSSETTPFLSIYALVMTENGEREFVQLVNETIQSEKAIQDVVIPIQSDIVSQTLIMICKNDNMKVLIYGEELNKISPDENQKTNQTNNLNLHQIKAIENNFLEKCRDSNKNIDLHHETSHLKTKLPVSNFRKLMIKAIIKKNIDNVKNEKEEFSSFDQSSNVRTEQIRPWLVIEKSSEKKEELEVHQEDEDLEELNLKILMRLKGLEEYLENPSILREDSNQLKMYLQTLEELCLIFENQNKSNINDCFQWKGDDNEHKIYEENKLIQVIKQVLKGEIDGVNEKSKAWRIFSIIVPQISSSNNSWHEVFQLILSSQKDLLENNFIISLNYSLKFSEIINTLWWNPKMRNEILNYSKSLFYIKYVHDDLLLKRDHEEFSNKKTSTKSSKLTFDDRVIESNSDVYYKILFSYCWNKLKECQSWFEYEQFRKFFIQVRISKLASSLRSNTRRLADMQCKHNSHFLEQGYQSELSVYLNDLSQNILSDFKSVTVLIKQLVKNRNLNTTQNNLSYLETILKKKKSIILKSARISKQMEELNENVQINLPHWLGNLLISEKILQTIVILLNLKQFQASKSTYNDFIKQTHQLLLFIASMKGGVAFLFSKPDLMDLLIKSVSQLSENSSPDSNIFKFNSFLIQLKQSVNLLNSLYKSFFAMFAPQDLIETLININKFIKKSLSSFCLVLKEPFVMDLFLMILEFENNSSLLYSMNKEVHLCLDIFDKCFLHSEHLFLNNKFNLVLNKLFDLANLSSSQILFTERGFNVLLLKINQVRNKMNPFELIQKDLQKFVLFFKEKSRYTHNNIQTLLSNRYVRFDEEREFPLNDFQKRITRLKNDYLTFFGNNNWENASLCISNLSMINVLIKSNPSIIQKFVENDCFSPVVSLINISSFVIQSFLEPGEFSARIRKIFHNSLQTVLLLFLKISKLCSEIIFRKTLFKLQNESFTKEYENIELFLSMLSLLKLGYSFFPNFVNKLINKELASEIGWVQKKLNLVRKNSFVEDLSDSSFQILKFLSQMESNFFEIFSLSSFKHELDEDSLQIFLTDEIQNSFKINLKMIINQLTQWSYFSGSFDVIMTQLLHDFFETALHKSLYLKIFALLIRKSHLLDQKNKHKKVIETLFLDKVRVLKKSSLIVFLKHGSNFADSFLDNNVIKNNQASVFGHLLVNFLPESDNEFIQSISIFITSLLLYREDSFIESIHRHLHSVFKSLTEELFNPQNNREFNLFKIIRFLEMLKMILNDVSFKEYFLENHLFIVLIDFYSESISQCKNIIQFSSEYCFCELIKVIHEILNLILYPFSGFSFPNSKVPKKFNGDYFMKNSAMNILKLIESINNLLTMSNKNKNDGESKITSFIDSNFSSILNILVYISCLQTGRCLIVFQSSHYILDQEKSIALRRKSLLNSKELVSRYKGELFSKIEFKFGKYFEKMLLKENIVNNVKNISLILLIMINILIGDDNSLKGISLLRVYFIEKVFFKKKDLAVSLQALKTNLEEVSSPEFNICQDSLQQCVSIISEMLKYLSNYSETNSKKTKIKKLFLKTNMINAETFDEYKGEPEKFKLRLQKYNIYYQKTIQGKILYDSDQMLEFLTTNNNCLLNEKNSDTNVLGIQLI